VYLLDSSFIIDFLNNRNGAVEVMSDLDHGLVSMGSICIAEVLEGLNGKKVKVFEDMINEIKVYDFTSEEAMVFAVIRRDLRKRGELIDNMDLLIAATCIANNLTLVTGNKKHFARIRGLRILG
jgi:predicted nucleic acid-binding protein